jgi:hypothetical protein
MEAIASGEIASRTSVAIARLLVQVSQRKNGKKCSHKGVAE